MTCRHVLKSRIQTEAIVEESAERALREVRTEVGEDRELAGGSDQWIGRDGCCDSRFCAWGHNCRVQVGIDLLQGASLKLGAPASDLARVACYIAEVAGA